MVPSLIEMAKGQQRRDALYVDIHRSEQVYTSFVNQLSIVSGILLFAMQKLIEHHRIHSKPIPGQILQFNVMTFLLSNESESCPTSVTLLEALAQVAAPLPNFRCLE